MTVNEYQQAAMTTQAPNSTFHLSPEMWGLTEGVIGLVGESGETLDILKKCIFQGHLMDDEKEHLANELGDVAWYLAASAASLGYSLEDICQRNLDKLRARYPGGFDPERSRFRAAGDL